MRIFLLLLTAVKPIHAELSYWHVNLETVYHRSRVVTQRTCGGQEVHPWLIPLSSYPSIVMMQSTEHWVPNYSLRTPPLGVPIIYPRVWYALTDTLVRSCVIEVGHIVANDPVHMALTQNQYMIQTFPSHAANEPLTYRVSFRRTHRGSDYLNLSILSHLGETLAILLVIVADQKPRSFGIRRCFPDLLSDPDITR